jgi:hypothetical protein
MLEFSNVGLKLETNPNDGTTIEEQIKKILNKNEL